MTLLQPMVIAKPLEVALCPGVRVTMRSKRSNEIHYNLSIFNCSSGRSSDRLGQTNSSGAVRISSGRLTRRIKDKQSQVVLTWPLLSRVLFVSLTLLNDTGCEFQCEPRAGLSGCRYILCGDWGSAPPAGTHWLPENL